MDESCSLRENILSNPMSYATKPHIREMFIPDDGHMMFELDLKQADLQIVICEAIVCYEAAYKKRCSSGHALLDLFNTPGSDIHAENFKIAFPGQKMTEDLRQDSKQLVHGTDYLGGIAKMAKTLNMSKQAVLMFQHRWFTAHPEISAWHKSTEYELQTTRTITNIFGNRKRFFDRLDRALPEALAWKPQSTVALIINRGIIRVKHAFPSVIPIMQVHDSFLGQIPLADYQAGILADIRRHMLIELPYPRPHTIDISVKCSARSWHHMEKVRL